MMVPLCLALWSLIYTAPALAQSQQDVDALRQQGFTDNQIRSFFCTTTTTTTTTVSTDSCSAASKTAIPATSETTTPAAATATTATTTAATTFSKIKSPVPCLC